MEVELHIFTPRWGRDDVYTITLERDRLNIKMHARQSEASYRENLDPEWSGESLDDIFRNDSIYAPAIFQELIEWAWLKWRGGEINDSQVEEELQELANWLNTITKAKPQTEFWKTYF